MAWTMKIVGNRKMDCGDPVAETRQMQHAAATFNPTIAVPKGVYRFRTFEEADEWMIRQIAKSLATRNLQTSRKSAKN